VPILALEHVQLAMPPGAEGDARAFCFGNRTELLEPNA
jgi:hypothetical protein